MQHVFDEKWNFRNWIADTADTCIIIKQEKLQLPKLQPYKCIIQRCFSAIQDPQVTNIVFSVLLIVIKVSLNINIEFSIRYTPFIILLLKQKSVKYDSGQYTLQWELFPVLVPYRENLCFSDDVCPESTLFLIILSAEQCMDIGFRTHMYEDSRCGEC
jgi:hypothetical protein